jgi:hypothetical protein
MNTRKQRLISGSAKYLLLIPVLLGFSYLMAKTNGNSNTEHVLQSNETSFNGNTFAWRGTDTLFYDKETGQVDTVAKGKPKKQIIYSMNGEKVYQNEYLITPATHDSAEIAYREYIRKAFWALCKTTADSSTGIYIKSLVINKEGRVVHFLVDYYRPYTPFTERLKLLYPFPKPEPLFNSYMYQIINLGPLWEPAKINGKRVNSLVTFGGGHGGRNGGC